MSLIHEMMRFGKFVGGGVSSWNDLPDRPFDIVELMPETQFVYNQNLGYFVAQTDLEFEVGRTYIVGWNGVEYTVAVKTAVFNNLVVYYMGNDAFIGGEDNGLPFVVLRVLYMPDFKGGIAAVPLDGSTSISVKISGVDASALYKSNSEQLCLDGRINTQTSDIAVVYGNAEEVLGAFTTGRKIVVSKPSYDSKGRLFSTTQYTVEQILYHENGYDHFLYFNAQTGQSSFSMKYNGDGTYVPYSD